MNLGKAVVFVFFPVQAQVPRSRLIPPERSANFIRWAHSVGIHEMTSVEEVVVEQPVALDRSYLAIDPEADALDALQTLRQFVLDELPSGAPPVGKWHGLDAYIEELCAYGIDKLSREPDDLNATSLRLRNDLEDVSCGNYRALIESFECAGAVREGVSDVRARLDELVLALPKLADATRKFSSNVSEKQKERDRRLRAITEHRAVSDILEMPRLMSTLIGSELYDEAIELRNNAEKLAATHPDERLISDICEEVEILTQQMVLQLLVLLRNNVQLPMCLRVVGFLRRLAVFSEFRLRMLFLHCRGDWMRTGIEAAVAATQQDQLVSLSDNTRAMIFEIVTQYRAVFNDDEEEEDEDDLINSTDITYSATSGILFDWTTSCIAEYLERLEKGTKNITEGAALNTVMQQAMYCGQSLGRVGADFRAALPPLFEDAVIRIYTSLLNAALRQFEMMIEDNRWAPVGSSALRKDRNQLYPSLENRDSRLSKGVLEVEETGSPKNEQYNPPIGVLDSPPLAVFLNGILAALNELRLCAPVSLGPRLGKVLQDTLINAGEYMSAIGGPGGAFLKRSDRPHFVSMAASLRDLCVQHAARCLDYCMNRNGLIDISYVHNRLNDVFGDALPQPSIGAETDMQLNGEQESNQTVEEEELVSSEAMKEASSQGENASAQRISGKEAKEENEANLNDIANGGECESGSKDGTAVDADDDNLIL